MAPLALCALVMGNDVYFIANDDAYNQVSGLLSARLNGLESDPHCSVRIAYHACWFIRVHGGLADYNNLVSDLGPGNGDGERGNSALVFSAIANFGYFHEYTLCPLPVAFEHGVPACSPRTLEHLVVTYATPTSLMLVNGGRFGLILDYRSMFHYGVPPSILLHIIGALKHAPVGSWTSTGKFAASVYRWYRGQRPHQMENADAVLYALLELDMDSLVAPQTALRIADKEIGDRVQLREAEVQYIKTVFSHPSVQNSSVDLVIVFRKDWQQHCPELCGILRPEPGTERDVLRGEVQAALDFFLGPKKITKSSNHVWDYVSTVVGPKTDADLANWRIAAANPTANAIVVLDALMDLQHIDHYTVSESILLMMAVGDAVEYRTALLNRVLTRGQAVDMMKLNRGPAFREPVGWMVRNGLWPTCDAVDSDVYRAFQDEMRHAVREKLVDLFRYMAAFDAAKQPGVTIPHPDARSSWL